MRTSRFLTFVLLITLGLGLSSCGSSKKKETAAPEPTMGASDTNNEDDYAKRDMMVNGDSDSGKAGAIRTIYFGFNSSNLNSDTRSTLQDNAEFLKANPSVEIQIEGHADERGGVQFNLALGEQRASAVKNYLISMGVSSSRITTISFGKERPIAFGHSENSWSRNRRANFVITAK